MLSIAVAAGLLIGVLLGSLGGGGSILTVPVLVYLLHQEPHAATAGSLLIVGITATAGMIAHWRAGRVRLAPGLAFGVLGVRRGRRVRHRARTRARPRLRHARRGGDLAAGHRDQQRRRAHLFIFYVIMGWFAVPAGRQHRVLLLSIGLALALRSVFIVAGAAALNRFGWLFYPLGGILVWTAAGLITGHQDGQPDRPGRLLSWLRRLAAGGDHGGRLAARPALLLVAVIGVADVLFAVDSIPAVFGITTSALLVVACNAFALMGLRQLYALVARVLDRIVYLKVGLGVICGLIGVKLLLHALRESGAGWAPEIPAWLSVLAVAAVLLITVAAGLVRGSAGRGRRVPPGAREQTVLERRFAVLDLDGNGVWQRDDYQQLTQRLCEAFGHAADSAAAQAVAAGQRALFDALLPHMDADGDQGITRDEFVTAVGRTVSDCACFDAAVRTAARTLVQAADQDGNGALDPGEYVRLAAVYGTPAREVARAFGRLDRDRNGLLDAAELAEAIGRFFTSRDPGTSGTLAAGHL